MSDSLLGVAPAPSTPSSYSSNHGGALLPTPALTQPLLPTPPLSAGEWSVIPAHPHKKPHLRLRSTDAQSRRIPLSTPVSAAAYLQHEGRRKSVGSDQQAASLAAFQASQQQQQMLQQQQQQQSALLLAEISPASANSTIVANHTNNSSFLSPPMSHTSLTQHSPPSSTLAPTNTPALTPSSAPSLHSLLGLAAPTASSSSPPQSQVGTGLPPLAVVHSSSSNVTPSTSRRGSRGNVDHIHVPLLTGPEFQSFRKGHGSGRTRHSGDWRRASMGTPASVGSGLSVIAAASGGSTEPTSPSAALDGMTNIMLSAAAPTTGAGSMTSPPQAANAQLLSPPQSAATASLATGKKSILVPASPSKPKRLGTQPGSRLSSKPASRARSPAPTNRSATPPLGASATEPRERAPLQIHHPGQQRFSLGPTDFPSLTFRRCMWAAEKAGGVQAMLEQQAEEEEREDAVRISTSHRHSGGGGGLRARYGGSEPASPMIGNHNDDDRYTPLDPAMEAELRHVVYTGSRAHAHAQTILSPTQMLLAQQVASATSLNAGANNGSDAELDRNASPSTVMHHSAEPPKLLSPLLPESIAEESLQEEAEDDPELLNALKGSKQHQHNSIPKFHTQTPIQPFLPAVFTVDSAHVSPRTSEKNSAATTPTILVPKVNNPKKKSAKKKAAATTPAVIGNQVPSSTNVSHPEAKYADAVRKGSGAAKAASGEEEEEKEQQEEVATQQTHAPPTQQKKASGKASQQQQHSKQDNKHEEENEEDEHHETSATFSRPPPHLVHYAAHLAAALLFLCVLLPFTRPVTLPLASLLMIVAALGHPGVRAVLPPAINVLVEKYIPVNDAGKEDVRKTTASKGKKSSHQQNGNSSRKKRR